MAYAYPLYFVDHLKVKIEQLLKPGENSLDSQSREILKLVYNHVDSFEETAKTTTRSDLGKAMVSEVYKLQHIVAQIGSIEFKFGREEEDDFQFAKDDVEGLKQRLHSFTLELKMLKQRCADALYNTFPDEDEDEDEGDDTVASKMIGAGDVYEQLKHRIMSTFFLYAVTSLVGMPGIGKTTLAKKLLHDPMIKERYDHFVWIRVGKKYRAKDIPRRILAEIDPHALVDDEEAVQKYLKKLLMRKRYLIVLDDVWDRYITYLWHPNYRYDLHELNHPFLQLESESHVLITSRLQQLDKYGNSFMLPDGVVQMRLLNKEESWDLLCDKVFGRGLSCPPQLVKAGKEIAKKCEGLPLTILTVARLLSQEESTPKYWYEVAAKRNHPLFVDAYNEMSKVLLPSYTYLPPLLKMCFLYIGLFRPKYKIPRTKLINLWLADRFLELAININSEFDAIGYLEELIYNSLVMVYEKSPRNVFHIVKTCGLHSSFWHLAKQKSKETKFALIISSPDDCNLGDGMQGHHRLSFQSNVLFGMKDVHKSVEDNCASAARSLLCFGPYHRYQVPLCYRLKLLRELDAVSIRFYEFPMEVLQLVRLTYLSLTLNGMIPTSIGQLQLLEFFIVDRHQSIKSCKDESYLPAEIWRLSALKYLQVMGSDLPDPPHGESLDSLLTLSKVSARSCTEAVLKGVPNLKELYIQIELTPDDDAKPLSWAYISHCSKLRSLKCVIVNPDVVPPVVPFPSFVENRYFKKLYLSGLSYPWEEMREIASLPFLSSLKLKNNAFQGSKWKVKDEGFNSLRTLVIEDVGMVDWIIGYGAFENLRSLTMKNCYKLENIYGQFGKGIREIEIFDCKPSSTEEIINAIPEEGITWILNVHTSWDEKLETTYGEPQLSMDAAISAVKIKEEQDSMGNDALQIQLLGSPSNESFKERVDAEGLSLKDIQFH